MIGTPSAPTYPIPTIERRRPHPLVELLPDCHVFHDWERMVVAVVAPGKWVEFSADFWVARHNDEWLWGEVARVIAEADPGQFSIIAEASIVGDHPIVTVRSVPIVWKNGRAEIPHKEMTSGPYLRAMHVIRRLDEAAALNDALTLAATRAEYADVIDASFLSLPYDLRESERIRCGYAS